jgi:hypothetical protein
MRFGHSVTTAVIGCVLISASADAAATTTVRSREILTQNQTLRGSMSFATPSAWRTTHESGVYTARFTTGDAAQCDIEISASIRGKATRRSAAAQAHAAIGDDAFAAGRRRGGVYRVGRSAPSWLYGIAVVRVQRRRFGQLRIFASFSGPDCAAAAAPDGSVTSAMANVLHHATSHLRVAR